MSRLEVWKHEPADKPGFVRFKEMCTGNELLEALTQYLKEQYSFADGIHKVYDLLDYLSLDSTRFDKDEKIPYARWIICWVVPGGSEGYYFHIESVYNSEHTSLIIGKTLCGVTEAYEINYWINKFLLEEIE